MLSGTSASCPVIAGMVSLINSARLDAGKPALGWLNPKIYALNGSFANDVTSGNNKCTRSASLCCYQGFYAAPGWDPVTGFGSVNFEKFCLAFGGGTSACTYSCVSRLELGFPLVVSTILVYFVFCFVL